MTSIRIVGCSLTALLAIVAVTGCAAAGPERPRPERATVASDESSQRIAKLQTLSDELLTELLADDQPGCSAAVGLRGEVVWAAAAGLADLTSREPLTIATRFEVASVSKQFTAALVLALVRDGLLSLDDPVSTHVAGLPAWGRTVTLEQLLHHTARLPDFWIELEAAGIGFSDPADQQSVLAAIRRVEAPLDGTGYSYANSHYVLLAAAVESVTGEPFATAMATRVLQPLGIDASVAPAAASADIAPAYEIGGEPLTAAWAVAGPIGIVTTPSELVRWGAQFQPGGLLADADAGAVDSSAGATESPDDDRPGERYGVGIRIAPDGTLFHAGRWGGSVSIFQVSADRELTIAVTCNQRDAPRMELAEGLEEIWSPPPLG